MEKEISLYIHIPFCSKKCIYCDFNSYDSCQQQVEPYIDCLLKEIEMYQRERTFRYGTVFIGGGTPTVIEKKHLGRIMDRISPFIAEDAEITIECNPGTTTKESLAYYRHIGINRLSIGLQAWQDKLLKSIGRIHSRKEFLETLGEAKNAGFSNINVDLMFALPGQSIEMWEETLAKVCSLGIPHVSCYSLKIEEGTPLWEYYSKGLLEKIDDETDRNMYHRAIEVLEKSGLVQYEISNFAREGAECRHNLVYWHNREYLGVGAGSHSKLDGRRFWNYKELDRYIGCVGAGHYPIEDGEGINREEDMWETVFLNLRLNEGLSVKAFEARYDVSFTHRYGSKINKLAEQGLVELRDGFVRLTSKGRDLSNLVFIELM